jgi:hypothetical protein
MRTFCPQTAPLAPAGVHVLYCGGRGGSSGGGVRWCVQLDTTLRCVQSCTAVYSCCNVVNGRFFNLFGRGRHLELDGPVVDAVEADLGSDRIVASEKEVQNMLANTV